MSNLNQCPGYLPRFLLDSELKTKGFQESGNLSSRAFLSRIISWAFIPMPGWKPGKNYLHAMLRRYASGSANPLWDALFNLVTPTIMT